MAAGPMIAAQVTRLGCGSAHERRSAIPSERIPVCSASCGERCDSVELPLCVPGSRGSTGREGGTNSVLSMVSVLVAAKAVGASPRRAAPGITQCRSAGRWAGRRLHPAGKYRIRRLLDTER